MRIILFRHGPAGSRDASRWPDDADRPLTSRGEERTRASCAGIRRLLGSGPTLIVTSPLARALRTAELLAETLGGAEVRELEALAPGGFYRDVLRFLADRDPAETVVLVGHEPDLGKLAGTLLFGAPSALPIKKAGAVAIQCVGHVEPGSGVLRWFLPPRLLRRLGGKKAKV